MATFNLPNATAGYDSGMVGIATAVPAFIPLLLFFIYLFVLISGMLASMNKRNTADVPMWSTLAGLSTTLVALVMSMKEGLMSLPILSVVIGITILSGAWLFLTSARGEA